MTYSNYLPAYLAPKPMPYSQFTTITQVKEAFGITTVEGSKFFPDIEPITPSSTLLDYLAESVPLAVAASTEKFRSEAIVTPILIELRRILERRISLFSGEEFNVDESVGLNGVCDFLISGSTEQMAVEAPVIVLLEAKKGDLRAGGQCPPYGRISFLGSDFHGHDGGARSEHPTSGDLRFSQGETPRANAAALRYRH